MTSALVRVSVAILVSEDDRLNLFFQFISCVRLILYTFSLRYFHKGNHRGSDWKNMAPRPCIAMMSREGIWDMTTKVPSKGSQCGQALPVSCERALPISCESHIALKPHCKHTLSSMCHTVKQWVINLPLEETQFKVSTKLRGVRFLQRWLWGVWCDLECTSTTTSQKIVLYQKNCLPLSNVLASAYNLN